VLMQTLDAMVASDQTGCQGLLPVESMTASFMDTVRADGCAEMCHRSPVLRGSISDLHVRQCVLRECWPRED
jgi:hypothetical protein